jgi:hypothetical protein
VTFTGCRFASNAISDADVADYGSGITFEYDTFEPSTVPAGSEPAISDTAYQIPNSQGYQYGIDQRGRGGALTVDHSRLWGFANAMQVWSSTAAAPLTITNSLFSNPRADGGTDHTDGPGVLNSGNTLTGFVVENNTIIGLGNANGLAFQPQGTTNHYVDGTVTGNYFSGYGFTMALGSGTETTGTVFEDNTWGTDIKPAWGPLYNSSPFTTPGLGNTWSGNKIQVVPGTTWMAAASDGMYWWPGDGNPARSSSAAGHATDFPNP